MALNIAGLNTSNSTGTGFYNPTYLNTQPNTKSALINAGNTPSNTLAQNIPTNSYNTQSQIVPINGGGGSSTPQQTYPTVPNLQDLATQYGNDYYNQLDNALTNYINQQQGFYQQQHDLTTNNLNTQNTQLLGTQGADASNAFLNGIYDPLLRQEGALQYQYGLDSTHNNDVYNLNSIANQQQRDLALQKLATDEQYNMASLNQNQGQDNQKQLEDLNSRGLLYGQNPGVGSYYQGDINSLGGVAGNIMEQGPNQTYDIQRGQLTGDYQNSVLGQNQNYTQQQGLLNTNHAYDNKNLAANTVNNINDQNRNYSYQTGMANNQLAMYQAQLAQQKADKEQQNRITADQYGANKAGVTYM